MPPLLVSLPASRLWRATLDLAGGMTRKLDALDSELHTHHHALVNLVDDEETLLREQSTIDDHDDLVAELGVRIQQLISICTSSFVTFPRKIAARRLSYSQKNQSSICTAVASLSGGPDDTCLLLQYEDQLGDSEKLVYLQHSLKGGSARNVIKGLSRSGEYYTEAVEFLQSRYNRPRLIHKRTFARSSKLLL